MLQNQQIYFWTVSSSFFEKWHTVVYLQGTYMQNQFLILLQSPICRRTGKNILFTKPEIELWMTEILKMGEFSFEFCFFNVTFLWKRAFGV